MNTLLGKSGGSALVSKAVVVWLRVGPVVLGQVLDVLDVLGADRAVVERVVPHAAVDAGVVRESCVPSRRTVSIMETART